MNSPRYVITMGSHTELDENGMFGGVEYESVLDSLDGVMPIELLTDWNLIQDLQVAVIDHGNGSGPKRVYRHYSGGHWEEIEP